MYFKFVVSATPVPASSIFGTAAERTSVRIRLLERGTWHQSARTLDKHGLDHVVIEVTLRKHLRIHAVLLQGFKMAEIWEKHRQLGRNLHVLHCYFTKGSQRAQDEST